MSQLTVNVGAALSSIVVGTCPLSETSEAGTYVSPGGTTSWRTRSNAWLSLAAV